MYKLPDELLNDLRVRVLRNQGISSRKTLKSLKLLVSPQPVPQKPIFESCDRKLQNSAIKHPKGTPILLNF